MGRDKNRFATTTVAICVNVLKGKNKLEKSILSWTVTTATTLKIVENKITSAFRALHNHTHIHNTCELFIAKLNQIKKTSFLLWITQKSNERNREYFPQRFLHILMVRYIHSLLLTHTQLLCTYLRFFFPVASNWFSFRNFNEILLSNTWIIPRVLISNIQNIQYWKISQLLVFFWVFFAYKKRQIKLCSLANAARNNYK